LPEEVPATQVERPEGSCVTFDKVSKSFGDLVVLRELDLEVAEGEHISIIGPSGSGKTTILRILMTLEQLDSGVVWVDGDPLWHMERNGRLVPADERHLRAVRGKVGMVFQQFNLFPHMTALQNVIEAPINVLRMEKEEAVERGKELLELVGLTEKADTKPAQLSGGQQQRVGIARALALRPKVLLLDEVTSALDPELVGEVLAVLRQLARDTSISMLIVTHEMTFARDVSHRVLFLEEGRILEEGPPEEIFTEPRNERTKQFLRAVLEH
jgi:polar amino acid transport system ATP-binding protein